jgi:formate hydrogenlyase subunit 6/NADH:ubiquinone oxidoreductase subunit I
MSVFCGLCVEACPEDAIRMDTGNHATPVTNRADAIWGKVDLLGNLGRKEAKGEQMVYQGAHEHRAREAKQGAGDDAAPVHAKIETSDGH